MLGGKIFLQVPAKVRSDAIPFNIEALYVFMNGVIDGILVGEFEFFRMFFSVSYYFFECLLLRQACTSIRMTPEL